MIGARTPLPRYNGRADTDIENRIKELGGQFGLKGLCCHSFWATEAACYLAICTDTTLCVGLPRHLGTRNAPNSTACACLDMRRSSATPKARPPPQTRCRRQTSTQLVARYAPTPCRY